MTYRGAYTALITPFRDNQVDVDALRALVDAQIEGGIHGLVPCGTTGESVTLSADEMAEVVQTVVEQAAGRVPVFAGAGTNDTRKTVELARRFEGLGVDGLLLVCPYYNKPNQRGLEAHFRAVMDAVQLPTMLYNIPGRTHSDLSVDTLARLADVPHLVAIKEATGNVVRAQEILCRLGDRIAVFSGDDGLSLPMMSLGGAGVVSVTSNAFPRHVAEVVDFAHAGNWDAARRCHLRLVPLHSAMFIEPNPGPVKAILAERGAIAEEIRLPMVWPTEPTLEHLRVMSETVALIDSLPPPEAP